jgi:hypothetical protein
VFAAILGWAIFAVITNRIEIASRRQRASLVAME